MGIFRTIKKETGTFASKVGEVLNSSFLSKIGAKLEERTDIITRTIGTSKSYRPETSTVRETMRVNVVLADYAYSIKNDTKDLENSLEKIMDEFVERMCPMEYESEEEKWMRETLKDVVWLPVYKDSVIRKRLVMESNKMKSRIRGTFVNAISRRISCGDRECLEIMRMKPSVEKEEKMKQFTKKVLKEASYELSNEIESVLRREYKLLADETLGRYQEVSVQYWKNTKQLKEFYKNQLNTEQRYERTQENTTPVLKQAREVIQLLETRSIGLDEI